MLTFGPVPSRRLGRSLGINNIPPKTCSYGCCYCQVGRTTHKTINRSAFYPLEAIRESVQEKLAQARLANERIDYLTFVPDGEPTLDSNLDREITVLGAFGLPIAVISNASLLSREDVRTALEKADWISLKMDSVLVEYSGRPSPGGGGAYRLSASVPPWEKPDRSPDSAGGTGPGGLSG